jgi:hypothetical protein
MVVVQRTVEYCRDLCLRFIVKSVGVVLIVEVFNGDSTASRLPELSACQVV